MRISLIAAMSVDRVIGINGKLPWHIPGDMRHFRRMTLGSVCIMGRKTWDSLPGPLPGRYCVVVTSDPKTLKGGEVWGATSVEQALLTARYLMTYFGTSSEIMVIGGERIYEQLLPRASRVYLTIVEGEYSGDAYMPLIPGQWRLTSTQEGEYSGDIPEHWFEVWDRE